MTPTIAVLHRFREALRVLEREITGQLRSETGCCGVSLAQCHALMELDATEPITLTELAGRFALDQSTLSRTVDGMVRSGLLARLADPDDRRAIRIGLTPSGKKTAAEIHLRCDAFYSSLLGGLSASEQAVVLKGISTLADGIRRQRSGSCGSSCCPPVPKTGKRKRG